MSECLSESDFISDCFFTNLSVWSCSTCSLRPLLDLSTCRNVCQLVFISGCLPASYLSVNLAPRRLFCQTCSPYLTVGMSDNWYCQNVLTTCLYFRLVLQHFFIQTFPRLVSMPECLWTCFHFWRSPHQSVCQSGLTTLVLSDMLNLFDCRNAWQPIAGFLVSFPHRVVYAL